MLAVFAFLAPLFPLETAAQEVPLGYSGDYLSPGGAIYNSGGFDRAAALALDANNNVYVAGFTNDPDVSQDTDTGNDWILIKYDPNGNPLSSATYNSPDLPNPGAMDNAPKDVLVAGEFVWVAGRNAAGGQIIKYDQDLVEVGAFSTPNGAYNGLVSDGAGGVYAAAVVRRSLTSTRR